jgi:hypothetical protein
VCFPPGVGICDTKFDHWFMHITSENETDFYKPIKNTIELRYRLGSALKAAKSVGDIKNSVRDYIKFFLYHTLGSTSVIKDPIALFSAEWLAEKFDMNVIVLIRHPAAFVSSIKARDWSFDFSNFIEQPLLLKNYLYPFEEELREYASNDQDLIDQGALLWKVMHYVILQYQTKHKEWIFIRHEDVSRNPLQEFQSLFNQLNLEFSQNVRGAIEYYSSSENPRDAEVPTGEISLRRNSELNISNWKYRLTMSETERIRKKVEDISRAFYSDEDWIQF